MHDTEILALIAIVNAECVDVTAANNDRLQNGYAMAYECFPDCQGANKALIQEMKSRGTLTDTGGG